MAENHSKLPDSDQYYRGHLPPAFYAGTDEYSSAQYISEPKYPGQMDEPWGNYGVGGYYGLTYQPGTRYRHETETTDRYRGQRDAYRHLGDRRWSGSGTSWNSERRLRPGYNSLRERLRYNQGHQGKGPRSYRRTDERILEDVNERMCDDPYLDASDIETTIHLGELVLAGTVENKQAKRRAEDIAESVPGIINVENRLRIRQ